MDTRPNLKLPANLTIKVPRDVALLLHRVEYETGRTKSDLVLDAIRKTYVPKEA